MTLFDWIPALTSTGLLAGAAWLFQSVITTRLTKTVQHQFDQKLETLRTQLRKSEEQFRAELQAKENKIVALRDGAMGGLMQRQALIEKRRLEAIDQLWAATCELTKHKFLVASFSVFNFEKALEAAADNQNVREMFSVLAQGNELSNFTNPSAQVRLYVSELAWAYFSAYLAIVTFANVKMTMIKNGLNKPKLLDQSHLINLITTALPHHTAYIQKHGEDAAHYLLDELEQSILRELRAMISGADRDDANLKLVADIHSRVEAMQQATVQAAAEAAPIN